MSKIMRAINHTMRVRQMVQMGDTQEYLKTTQRNADRAFLGEREVMDLRSTSNDKNNLTSNLISERETIFKYADLNSDALLSKNIKDQNINLDLIKAGIDIDKLSDREMNDLKTLKVYDNIFGGNDVPFAERLKNAAPKINDDLDYGGFRVKGNSFASEIRPSIVEAITFSNGVVPENKKTVSLVAVNKQLMENDKVQEAFSDLEREQFRFDQSKGLLGKIRGLVEDVKVKFYEKYTNKFEDDIVPGDIKKESSSPSKPEVEDIPLEKDSEISELIDGPSDNGMTYEQQEKAVTEFLDKDTDFNNSISDFLKDLNKENEKEMKKDEPEIKTESPSM